MSFDPNNNNNNNSFNNSISNYNNTAISLNALPEFEETNVLNINSNFSKLCCIYPFTKTPTLSVLFVL